MAKEDPLHAFVAKVLVVPPDEISDDSSPESVRAWDSLGHLRLVIALEERLGRELDPDDILGLETVGDIRRILERHGDPWAAP